MFFATPWQASATAIIPHLRPWLLSTASLTQAIRRCCPGNFRVSVSAESWAVPLPEECAALNLPPRHRAWVRQVYLYCGQQPWVFARTVVPAATLSGPGRRLRHLGARPLGTVLFRPPGARRGRLEIAGLRPRHRLLHIAAGGLAEQPRQLWARRSLFYLDGKPLLVTEIFLPGLAERG